MCGVSTVYQKCCGKRLCYGCVRAAEEEMNKGNMKRCCPFCRLPLANSVNEDIQRLKRRMKLNDANAFLELAGLYFHGINGLPQDYRKAFTLFNRGAELGSVHCHCLLASMYHLGQGVDKDEEKAEHHYKIAAIGENEYARNALGIIELKRGNTDRAMKHYMISARCGYDKSMKGISKGYKAGHVTKDEFASTLRAYRTSQDEMKSEQREIAAAMRGQV